MYAVYQVGYAIYGVGETPDEARADAAQWLRSETAAGAPIHRRGQFVIGDIVVIPCTTALVEQVKYKGGNGGFFAVDGGLCTIEESGAL